MTELAEKLPDDIDARRQHAVELRRWLHRHPELSFNEAETAARVVAELEHLGISCTTVCNVNTITSRPILHQKSAGGIRQINFMGDGVDDGPLVLPLRRRGEVGPLRVDDGAEAAVPGVGVDVRALAEQDWRKGGRIVMREVRGGSLADISKLPRRRDLPSWDEMR